MKNVVNLELTIQCLRILVPVIVTLFLLVQSVVLHSDSANSANINNPYFVFAPKSQMQPTALLDAV